MYQILAMNFCLYKAFKTFQCEVSHLQTKRSAAVLQAQQNPCYVAQGEKSLITSLTANVCQE